LASVLLPCGVTAYSLGKSSSDALLPNFDPRLIGSLEQNAVDSTAPACGRLRSADIHHDSVAAHLRRFRNGSAYRVGTSPVVDQKLDLLTSAMTERTCNPHGGRVVDAVKCLGIAPGINLSLHAAVGRTDQVNTNERHGFPGRCNRGMSFDSRTDSKRIRKTGQSTDKRFGHSAGSRDFEVVVTG